MKLYFVGSIIFAILATGMAINENASARSNLLIPVLILYFMNFILFTVEYDNERQKQWRIKEKRLIEKIYLRFFKKDSQES